MEKPILFNTKMVRAILNGEKTQTRRLIKPAIKGETIEGFAQMYGKVGMFNVKTAGGSIPFPLRACDYQQGDVLYVRETWNYGYIETSDAEGSCDAWFEPVDWRKRKEESYLDALSRYWYKADGEELGEVGMFWRPSIHMPKEAARIFLRVREVRAERLHEIMDAPPGPDNPIVKEGCTYGFEFIAIWDNTINPAERSLCGWNANPWVWVIEFERVDKPGREWADYCGLEYADGGALAPAT